MNLSVFFTNLFIINILIDPGNALFHSKIITYFLFIWFNIKNLKFKRDTVFSFILFYLCFLISTSIMICSNERYDPSFLKMYSTTFLTLGVLFFTDCNSINLWKPFKLAALIISIVTLLMYFIILFIPASLFFVSLQNLFTGVFMIAEHKKLLYWWFPSIFHKSSPVVIIVAAYYLYKFLYNKRKKYFLLTTFYFFVLFITGTRANVLASLLVIFFVSLYYLFYIKKYIGLSSLLFLFGMICSFIIIYLLFTVKNSSSFAKDGHLISYIDYFSNNFKNFLFGQGPGSWFYTSGFHSYATNTELSYFELIRMFGIFFTIIIVGIYLYPMLGLLATKNFFSYSIAISYLAYLFIAGTNPLLIGPTGFSVLTIAFYFKNHKGQYEKY